MIIQLQEFLSEKYYRVTKLFKTLKIIQKEMTKKSPIFLNYLEQEGQEGHQNIIKLRVWRYTGQYVMARNFTLPTPKQRRRKVNFLGKPMNRCTRQK